MEYTGNAIYDYVYNENLDYYYSAGIMRGYPDDRRTALCQTDSGTFWCF